jgi:hypothetical protein
VTDTNLPANPQDLTTEDYTKAMIAAGVLPASAGGTEIRRIRHGQGVFEFDDDRIFTPNDGSPAFIAQIVDAPAFLHQMWFADDEAGHALANAIGRPGIAGKMCKSYDEGKPKEQHRSDTDGTPCVSCLVNPWTPKDDVPLESPNKRKCSLAMDIELRRIDPATGTVLVGDEAQWTLTLPMNSVFEWKGSWNDPVKGTVSDLNFMQKLMRLATTKFPDLTLLDAIQRANLALARGGVIAEVRSIQTKSASGNRYYVVSFNPIDIIDPGEESPALPDTSEPTGDTDPETDAIPF